VRTATLVGSQARLVAWQWYWVDGEVTADPVHASLLQLLARLRGRSETSAWVSVYTMAGDDPAAAPKLLEAFVSDMSAAIDAALARSAAASLQASTGI